MVATTAAVANIRVEGTNNVMPQSGSATLNFRHLPGEPAINSESQTGSQATSRRASFQCGYIALRHLGAFQLRPAGHHLARQ